MKRCAFCHHTVDIGRGHARCGEKVAHRDCLRTVVRDQDRQVEARGGR